MRIAVRLVLVLFVLGSCYVLAQEASKAKKETKPALTDAQKLEIRSAQVKVYQTKEVMEQTPQFKAFSQSQSDLNAIVLRIQREVAADSAKWQLGQDLEYVAIPQPEPPKTDKK